MPFKDPPNGQTQYLDENGELVGQIKELSPKKSIPDYFKAIMVIERFQRLFLREMTNYLNDRQLRDINYVQCLILYNIGDSQIIIGQLHTLGYYLGANVSYNVRKMIQNGYIISTVNEYDLRAIYLRLSEKGISLYHRLYDYFLMKSNALELYDTQNNRLPKSNDINHIFDKFLNINKIGCLQEDVVG